MKKNNPIYKTIAILIFLFVLMGGFQTLTAKEDIKTITILPFKIHAQEKLSHIQDGIVQMLYSRLSWKDNVLVVPQKQLASHLSAIDKTKTDKGINEIARLTHSDFVLEGAITQLGGSFSIDVQVYDIENKRYMAFFEQSQQKDDLISKTNRIAASINKEISNTCCKIPSGRTQKNHPDGRYGNTFFNYSTFKVAGFELIIYQVPTEHEEGKKPAPDL